MILKRHYERTLNNRVFPKLSILGDSILIVKTSFVKDLGETTQNKPLCSSVRALVRTQGKLRQVGLLAFILNILVCSRLLLIGLDAAFCNPPNQGSERTPFLCNSEFLDHSMPPVIWAI